jgi:hypothetical protein
MHLIFLYKSWCIFFSKTRLASSVQVTLNMCAEMQQAGLHVECPLPLSHVNQDCNVLTNFSKILKIPNFMMIHPVLVLCYMQTDV